MKETSKMSNGSKKNGNAVAWITGSSTVMIRSFKNARNNAHDVTKKGNGMNAKNFDPKKLEQTPVTDANATEKRPINAVDFTPDHEMMINDLLALRTHQNFLEAIYEWGEEKGWLTEAQDAKLKEIYDDH